jgi:hypothetical protein
MNGNWYPWSLNSTPTDYILAWQHIHDIISNKSLDSTRLQWIWCVGNVDVGSYTAENYWVGENYIDWIGIDGYNFGTSQTWSTWLWPNQVFDNMIQRLNSLSSTKPICINEYATTSIFSSNISNIQSKLNWLNQFCVYIFNNNQIKMVSYFNQDKETDWAIFGGIHGDTIWNNFSVYSSYNNCLQLNYWISSDNTNQRILTDQQFAGIDSSNQQISSKIGRQWNNIQSFFLLIIMINLI